MKTWTGPPPQCCDLCKTQIASTFVDGKTRRGPWANMCVPCFNLHGVGLGTGLGQLYALDLDTGKFVNVESIGGLGHGDGNN